MARGRGRRRGRGHGDAHEGPDERWLVSYADMITLLMCLFMVLFSISSVNTSRFDSLQKSLNDAFSGSILPGGTSVLKTGNSSAKANQSAPQPPIEALRPTFSDASDKKASQAAKQSKKEDEDFKKLKQRLDTYAKAKHVSKQLETIVTSRGLVIRVLTDKLLFDSGQANIKPAAGSLLGELAHLVGPDEHHVSVEGHTDNQPISGGQYPSNWELSTARASSVLRALIDRGVAERRFEAAGYADLYPIADNSSEAGRTRNRRVEIVLLRKSFERQGRPFNP